MPPTSSSNSHEWTSVSRVGHLNCGRGLPRSPNQLTVIKRPTRPRMAALPFTLTGILAQPITHDVDDTSCNLNYLLAFPLNHSSAITISTCVRPWCRQPSHTRTKPLLTVLCSRLQNPDTPTSVTLRTDVCERIMAFAKGEVEGNAPEPVSVELDPSDSIAVSQRNLECALQIELTCF